MHDLRPRPSTPVQGRDLEKRPGEIRAQELLSSCYAITRSVGLKRCRCDDHKGKARWEDGKWKKLCEEFGALTLQGRNSRENRSRGWKKELSRVSRHHRDFTPPRRASPPAGTRKLLFHPDVKAANCNQQPFSRDGVRRQTLSYLESKDVPMAAAAENTEYTGHHSSRSLTKFRDKYCQQQCSSHTSLHCRNPN